MFRKQKRNTQIVKNYKKTVEIYHINSCLNKFCVTYNIYIYIAVCTMYNIMMCPCIM